MSSNNKNGRNEPLIIKLPNESYDLIIDELGTLARSKYLTEEQQNNIINAIESIDFLSDYERELLGDVAIAREEDKHVFSHHQNEDTYNEMVKGELSGFEMIKEVLDDDDFYDGHYDDLMPWTFSLSDFQHPEQDIELLFDIWNSKPEDLNMVKGCLSNGGYIYYVEAHALLYEVVISPNMGLDSFNVVATEEEL